jgi:hypothetical protein
MGLFEGIMEGGMEKKIIVTSTEIHCIYNEMPPQKS